MGKMIKVHPSLNSPHTSKPVGKGLETGKMVLAECQDSHANNKSYVLILNKIKDAKDQIVYHYRIKFQRSEIPNKTEN